MRLVADTNVLFTFFWKDSIVRMVLGQGVALAAPAYALKELETHRREILKKAKISVSEFGLMKNELREKVAFVEREEYDSCLKEAASCADGLDAGLKAQMLDDLDFLALALKFGCPLWSNDKLLKHQKKADVLATAEVIELVDYVG